MSHSLASWAALIFSKACWLSRCAAARFGWRAADTFLLGWAMTAPPIKSREPRTAASVRDFSIWRLIIPEPGTKRYAVACLGCLTVLGTRRTRGAYPVGKPWYSHRISGKPRRKFEAVPGLRRISPPQNLIQLGAWHKQAPDAGIF